MSFAAKKAELERAARALSLNVLVWGPGQSAQEHYDKRIKLRNVISENFPRAEVYFSEDDELKGLVNQDLPLSAQELQHLAYSDICVVLDTSKGAGEEIAHFTRSPFSARLFILTNAQYEGANTFPASLRESQSQIFYSDDEYESCNLCQRVVERLDYIALCRLGDLA